GPTQPIAFADRGDGGPPGATLEPDQGLDGIGPADLIGDQTGVALEVSDRGPGPRTEDAVDPTGVESERAEPQLELGDVVAAHHRRTQAHQPIAQTELRFDQSSPGSGVADAVAAQAGLLLEPADRRSRPLAELARRVAGGVPGRGETPLQVGHGGPDGAGAQRKGGEGDDVSRGRGRSG